MSVSDEWISEVCNNEVFTVGARAIESEEGDAAIVIDPLAAKLAGKRALKAARGRREPAPPANDMGRKNKIGRIAVRTKWFDDQLEASLGMPSSAGMSHVVQTVGDRMPMQVVELGAGLSTRPWRLHLPATVHWFDVDRQDVLDAKEILLEKYGAEVDLMSPVRRSMSKNSMLESKIGSIDHHFEGVQYPLRCASRVGVAADLGHKGWTKSLMAAGFDPNRPTVWIAEGLLMYLEEEHVGELLEETRSISAPGSAFLTVSVSEQVIKEIKNPSSKKNKGLMKEWVFGCPEDPTEVCFFLFAFFFFLLAVYCFQLNACDSLWSYQTFSLIGDNK